MKVAIKAELEGGVALAADEELGGAAAVADEVADWTGGVVEDEAGVAEDDVAVAGPTGAGSTGGTEDCGEMIAVEFGGTDVGASYPPGAVVDKPAGEVEEGDSSSAVQSSSPSQEWWLHEGYGVASVRVALARRSNWVRCIVINPTADFCFGGAQ